MKTVFLSFLLSVFTFRLLIPQDPQNFILPGSRYGITENQPQADQGNGYYRNPVMPGNYGDPSIVKKEKDYYMAFSRGNGFILWHSRDLVNWKPVIRHTFKDISRIWAVDLQFFNGKYYLFMPPANFPGRDKEHYHANYVTWSVNPEGPWSEPVRIDREFIPDTFYTGIDPGFIQTPEGKKFLYTDHGFVMPLSDDALRATEQPRVVYDGWKYPESWVVQCKCLESPKLLQKEGYYYLVSASGGTSGPSTAHMAIVARSLSPTGPWENSPYNPLIHTFSGEEKWWQMGHATIIEGPAGGWWTLFHARLNGYPELGRQTLLMPVKWTSDGWPVIKDGYQSWDMIPMPAGENIGNGMAVSDDFSAEIPGIQWIVEKGSANRIHPGNGKLVMEARGSDMEDATRMQVMATNISYEATVRLTDGDGTAAGLVFGNGEGLVVENHQVRYSLGAEWRTRFSGMDLEPGSPVYLKIRNYRKDLSFFASRDGINWVPFQNGVRSGQYSIRLIAYGQGEVVFEDFRYLGLE